jgi:hypothetical protein
MIAAPRRATMNATMKGQWRRQTCSTTGESPTLGDKT